MIRRKLKRNLGVSTVIANMLMISITLVLAAILVAWAGTTYGAFSSGSQLFFVQRGQALQERFVVENVFFNKTANQIMIFVRDVGVEEVNIVAVYVNGAPFAGSSMGVLSPCSLNTKNAVTLVVGSNNPSNVCEFRIVISSWTTGDIFTVVVASTRGNQATFNARGP